MKKNHKKAGAMIGQILSSVWQKAATVNYPFAKFEIANRFRGKINFTPEKCIGCKLCMRDCPANAINIIKTGDKKFKAEILLDHCIYCGQCVDVCAKQALSITREFELARLSRKDLIITYEAPACPGPETLPS
jgi:formate hydrogenlyase subunit 6/NADH:ubiquinone oxidoreductase subunit I